MNQLNNSQASGAQAFEIIMYFGNRIYVSKQDHDELVATVNFLLPAITRSMVFKLEDLYQPIDWQAKSTYRRQMLGRLFPLLFVQGEKLFRFADESCRTPKRYRRAN